MPDVHRGQRSRRRLTEELEDDGIVLAGDDATVELIVAELDHARRSPFFEGRRLVYGSIVTSAPEALRGWDGGEVDVVDAPGGIEEARTYSDGRSSFVVRDPEDAERVAVACFGRSLQFESDLVDIQHDTGALILQRTPVFGITRLYQPGQVVSWNEHSWVARPTARNLLPALRENAPDLDPRVGEGLLTLAIHWLAPQRAGATIVIHDGVADGSFDTSGAVTTPPLTLTDRRHLPPMQSTLAQRDLATLVAPHGTIEALGVGLISGAAADIPADPGHGMRHRSAQRWSAAHPDAIVTVVSTDGPVTVYRGGEVILGAI